MQAPECKKPATFRRGLGRQYSSLRKGSTFASKAQDVVVRLAGNLHIWIGQLPVNVADRPRAPAVHHPVNGLVVVVLGERLPGVLGAAVMHAGNLRLVPQPHRRIAAALALRAGLVALVAD